MTRRFAVNYIKNTDYKYNLIIISILRLTLSMLVLAFCANLAWAERVYEQDLDESKWQTEKHHPLRCRIYHEIEHYGVASFYQEAGQPLGFEMVVLRPPSSVGQAKVWASPPYWLPHAMPEMIADVKVYEDYRAIRLNEELSRRLLVELEEGWFPSFQYNDWEGQDEMVIARLSAVSFKESFYDYAACLKQLMPFGFDDIDEVTIYFGPGSSTLNKQAKQYLERVRQYLEVDPELKTVILKGYSDSNGPKKQNYLMSIDRVRVVKDWFLSLGISEDDIEALAYGERNPAASNKTANGRAKNRRVVVQLIKP